MDFFLSCMEILTNLIIILTCSEKNTVTIQDKLEETRDAIKGVKHNYVLKIKKIFICK